MSMTSLEKGHSAFAVADDRHEDQPNNPVRAAIKLADNRRDGEHALDVFLSIYLPRITRNVPDAEHATLSVLVTVGADGETHRTYTAQCSINGCVVKGDGPTPYAAIIALRDGAALVKAATDDADSPNRFDGLDEGNH